MKEPSGAWTAGFTSSMNEGGLHIVTWADPGMFPPLFKDSRKDARGSGSGLHVNKPNKMDFAHYITGGEDDVW